jgi:uncharacterized protein YecT (DUF1311 family)
MRMKRGGRAVLAAICLLALAAAPARAQTQLEMNQGAAGDAAKADRELNAVYQTLWSRYTPQSRALLLKAQRSWLKYRDDHCAFVASGSEGGSIQPMIYSMCIGEMTAARVKELRFHLNCEEGDVSCIRE